MKGKELLAKFKKNKEKVRDVLGREHVLVAYLFGSGTGEVGPLSDLDFAIYLDPDLTGKRMDELHLKILNDLITVLGDDVDLVLMNSSSTLFNFNVIREGEVLYKNSERDRVKLESSIIDRNADEKYYREKHARKMIRKFAEEGLA